MRLHQKILHLKYSNPLVFILGLMLVIVLSPQAYGQEEDLFGTSEDDSLLFGDEFDLGGDDFSFDLEEDAEAPAEDSAEDDFFGDFEEDEAEEDSVAVSDSTEIDEWGLESSDDYNSLITKTSSGDGSILETEINHPLDFRKYVAGTFLEGTGFTISLYSPQVVGDNMETWFSFMDYSFTSELPWHFTFDPVELSFSLDISSFNFNNSFPAGGEFKGVSVIPIARAESFGAEVELGMGMYYPSFGMLAGIGYTYQFHSLFASAGYRWNWALNIDPIGAGWWLEPRFTFGVKFW